MDLDPIGVVQALVPTFFKDPATYISIAVLDEVKNDIKEVKNDIKNELQTVKNEFQTFMNDTKEEFSKVGMMSAINIFVGVLTLLSVVGGSSYISGTSRTAPLLSYDARQLPNYDRAASPTSKLPSSRAKFSRAANERIPSAPQLAPVCPGRGAAPDILRQSEDSADRPAGPNLDPQGPTSLGPGSRAEAGGRWP
ncbi:hypothetical protein T492DRAFT_1146122 [Pavlovales sp. CCMP2436]|nr:hypothetical protein T492DRAFT_1146122 [Pavlovales sp. CCMP2436]